jgi:hypothetical protein
MANLWTIHLTAGGPGGSRFTGRLICPEIGKSRKPVERFILPNPLIFSGLGGILKAWV